MSTAGRVFGSAVSLALLISAGCSTHPGSPGPAQTAWKTGVSIEDFSLQSLRAYKAAGVQCVEIPLRSLMTGPAENQTEACRQLVSDAKQAGVVLWSVHLPYGKGWDISVTDPGARAKALGNLQRALELCRVLHPRKAVIHPSAEPISDEERPARLSAAREALVQLTPEFAAAGVQLALEDLPRTCLGNTSDEILWLIEDIKGLGVCFDTNHLLKGSQEEFIQRVGSRIVTMHASDYDRINERHWLPGEGVNDWKVIVKGLAAAGYSGPFMFESRKHKDGTPIRPEEYAACARSLLQTKGSK